MRHWAWFSSYASRAAGKSPAALLLLLAVLAGSQEQLNLRLGSGQAGVASWSAAEFSWQPDMSRQGGCWQLSVDELNIDSWRGCLVINCLRGSAWHAGAWRLVGDIVRV